MRFTTRCLAGVVFCLLFFCALPAAAQITATCSPECYGPGIGSDGLANTTVGPNGNTVSYRFRAGHTGDLAKIHIYLIPDKTGYAAGTGGQIQITVNADDGTSAHSPSSTVLASYLLSAPLAATPSRYFPIITFAAPPPLVAGALYHIVFKNVDPNPSVNYLSVDALYLAKPTTPAQPTISDIDGAELLKTNNQAWQPRKGYLPILQLDFADGWSEGTGYMEVWIGAPQTISGTAGVREQFTVAGTPRAVSSVAVRVARVSGPDALKVRLQESDGTLIEEGSIPAASFPTALSHVWAEYQFRSAQSLASGKTYFLELSTAATSSYQAFPIRKGPAYNFARTTYFPDGFAQFKTSNTWTGWTQWGVTNRTDSDLQFYFEVAGGTKLVISNVTGTPSANGATIAWATDQDSDGQVEYGATTAYGSTTAVNSNPMTSHSQTITGLAAGTQYHYRVRSALSFGTTAVSADFTFTTKTVPPVISGLSAGSVTTNGSIVSWTTDQAADGQVEYGTSTAYGMTTTFNPAMASSHAQVLSNLTPGTIYHYRVRSSNSAGDLTTSADQTFTTISVPPVISNLATGSVSSSGAMISWSTDQPASGTVEYGATTAYGNATAINPTMATSHAQALSGLAWGTLYHYRVRSRNSWGDEAISSDVTFTTATVPPLISGVVADSVTTTGATIQWTTDQASNSQVEYGLTTGYGTATALDTRMVAGHSQSLSGLTGATLYHYRVRSTNAWGDQSTSGDLTFTTGAAPVSSPAMVSCSAGCYGPGLAADALSSATVGGASGNVVSYRFRAQHSGALDRIHFYMLPNVAGYGGGTGGRIQITVQADDGTSAHNPSTTVLASFLMSNPIAATPSKYFPIVAFSAQPALTAGQLYHIVFTNVDASPTTNYVSISSLYQSTAPTPAQPSVSDTDSAQLLRTTGGTWALRKGYTPILQVDYKNGTSQGTGYMEVWVGAPQTISGSNAVRETFTVSGGQKIVKGVAVRVGRVNGTAPLTVRLEDGAGNLIEQRDIPSSSIPMMNPVSYTWVGFTFSTPRTLAAGQTYHLVLQSGAGSAYQAYPLRKGSAYSFQNTTFFADGYAQFKTATSSWTGWTQWGVANRTDSDVQFYFGF